MRTRSIFVILTLVAVLVIAGAYSASACQKMTPTGKHNHMQSQSAQCMGGQKACDPAMCAQKGCDPAKCTGAQAGQKCQPGACKGAAACPKSQAGAQPGTGCGKH
jgi:hypothetical protein